MRYAGIDEYEVANGIGNGTSLYIQGCDFHCPGCFNSETWDFNGGKEWTEEIEDKFIELANRPYIKRISILGGEPLANENLSGMIRLISKIRKQMPEKTIWLYTGYNLILEEGLDEKDDFWNDEDDTFTYIKFFPKTGSPYDYKRRIVAHNVDVIVDGRYIESKKDPSLRFKGSANQRVIDIQKSLEKGDVVLWDTF